MISLSMVNDNLKLMILQPVINDFTANG
jgi:hypothetical protein